MVQVDTEATGVRAFAKSSDISLSRWDMVVNVGLAPERNATPLPATKAPDARRGRFICCVMWSPLMFEYASGGRAKLKTHVRSEDG